MSSISGIGSTGAESLQYLWQMAQQEMAVGTTRAPQAPPQGGEGPPQLWEDVEESAQTAGLTEEQIDALKTDLKEAISSAMEAARQSDDREAGHKAIDNAILTTLQEYGVDTTEIESRMTEAKNRMQNMPPPQQDSSGAGIRFDSELLASLAGSTSEESNASTLLSMLFPLVDDEA
ncbi:MAG: hypothetical protein JXQ75_00415 [Phycisphaerae bacterium]|nr:hypothetical protein [Phycisphaerae bacterium]